MNAFAPLAERMRPTRLEDVLGQAHLTDVDSVLMRALSQKRPYSMILWGPPGCGKTTIARLVAQAAHAELIALSAVLAGVAELRSAIQTARSNQHLTRRTVLFIDEIHRFNKAQQDALLPHVEDGTVVLIGATTENPSFVVNGALLSRARVHILKTVDDDALRVLLTRALESELSNKKATDEALDMIIELSDGDARRALGLLEIACELASNHELDRTHVQSASGARYRRFDKSGDLHFDQISALHKTIRSSNPDAALYWFVRMIDGGVDPEYLARRLLRVASEDIGNADPRALSMALEAWQTFERLGAPEGELALAQLVLYLAIAPKSNASYTAFKAARKLIAEKPAYAVPNHLRNAPTKLMKEQGFGENYQYDHDHPDAIAIDQTGLPPELFGIEFYHPVPRGLEIKLAEKLAWIRGVRKKQRFQT